MLNTTKATTKAVAKNTKPLTAKQIATQASKTATVTTVAPVLQVPVAVPFAQAHNAFAQMVQQASITVAPVAVVKAVRVAQPVQNGVKRPRDGGLCAQAWAVMDKMSAEKKSPVAIAELILETTKLGLNPGNVRCEYTVWKKFNGIAGRVAKVAIAVQVQGRDMGLVPL